MDQINLRRFDALEAVRLRREFSGEVPLARLMRLAKGLPEQSGSAGWRVRGEVGPLGESLLRLYVKAAPVVVCQRCLEPFELAIESEAVLQLVTSEAELDADEPLSDDEFEQGYDKVLASNRFDLQEQIEDELILSVPYIPRHENCSSGASTENDAPEPDRQRPFAGLSELKNRLGKP